MRALPSPTPFSPPGGFAASGQSIRRAVGFAPELSSASAGWRQVALYAWRGECGAAEFEPFDEPVIVYHVGGAQTVPVRLERRWDRRTHPGLITVIPPRTRIGWDIRGEVHSRTVHLGRAFFADDDDVQASGDDLRFQCGVRDPLLIVAIQALEGELRSPGQHGTLYADSVSQVMALHLLRESRRPVPSSGPQRLSRERLGRVIDRIEDSIETGVSLQALADEAALSRTRFAAAFRGATGLSPHRYLTQRRLARARELLLHSTLSLAQVALRCGFSSQAHFTEYFRREVGATPQAFRRSAAD